MAFLDSPLLTKIFTLDSFVPTAGSTYLYAKSKEERSEHLNIFLKGNNNVTFFEIDEGENSFQVIDKGYTVHLRSNNSLNTFWNNIHSQNIYLDITGLSHHIWAPLIKSAINLKKGIKVVYVEPRDYTFNATPTEGQIFDLSEKIKGISPIPGFAYLREPGEENICFIALLGFEGTRFSYIIEQMQPLNEKIIPIIGVPGFRPEYPFYSYHGNRSPLKSTGSWKNVVFAPANCPFSIYHKIDEISNQYTNHLLRIALIGTKPHSLGAILYSIMHSDNVEIIYDHPIRKSARTQGVYRLLVYDISKILEFYK